MVDHGYSPSNRASGGRYTPVHARSIYCILIRDAARQLKHDTHKQANKQMTSRQVYRYASGILQLQNVTSGCELNCCQLFVAAAKHVMKRVPINHLSVAR